MVSLYGLEGAGFMVMGGSLGFREGKSMASLANPHTLYLFGDYYRRG